MVVTQVEVNDINFPPLTTRERAVSNPATITKKTGDRWTLFQQMVLPSKLSPPILQAGDMVWTNEQKSQESERKTTPHDIVHPHESPQGDQKQRAVHVVGGG